MKSSTSPDVLSLLQGAVQGGVLKLVDDTLPGLGQPFTEYLGGGLDVTLSADITGDSASAKVVGTGSSQPFESFTLSAEFTATGSNVAIDLAATVTSPVLLSTLFPGTAASQFPLDTVTLQSGEVDFDVTYSGDATEVTFGSGKGGIQFTSHGTALGGVGLAFLVQYKDSSLGFAVAGEITNLNFGSIWSDLSLLDQLVVSELFLGLSSIDTSLLDHDLAPGVQASASLELTGSMAWLGALFPGTTLDLAASLTEQSGNLTAKVSAALVGNLQLGSLDFTKIEVDFTGSSATFSVKLSASADFQPTSSQKLTLTADATVVAWPTPSGSFGLTVSNWANPFGIPNVTIDSFGFSISLEAEGGVNLDLAGSITIGTSQPNPVIVSLSASIEDFEVPDSLSFSMTSASGASVSVTDLIDDFLDIDIGTIPVLSNIGFKNISLDVTGAPYTDPNGNPQQSGIKVAGDITFYSWELDFAFSVASNGIAASGSLSAPINIPSGSPVISISAASDASKGPSGSLTVDDKGFALDLDGSISMFGLTESIQVSATDDSLTLDVSVKLFNVASATFICDIDPAKDVFTASLNANIDLTTVTIPAFVVDGTEIFPALNLTLNASVAFAASIDTSAGTFGFDLDLNIFGATLDVGLSVDLGSAATALANGDFTGFVEAVLTDTSKVFASILKDVEAFAKFMWQIASNIGKHFDDVVNAIVLIFGLALEEAIKLVSDLVTDIEGCVAEVVDPSGDSLDFGASHVMTDGLVALAATPGSDSVLRRYYRAAGGLRRTLNRSARMRGAIVGMEARRRAAGSDSHMPIVTTTLAFWAKEEPQHQARLMSCLASLQPYAYHRLDDLLDELG